MCTLKVPEGDGQYYPTRKPGQKQPGEQAKPEQAKPTPPPTARGLPQQKPLPPKVHFEPPKPVETPRFNQEELLRIIGGTKEFDDLPPVRAIKVQALIGRLILADRDIPPNLQKQIELLSKYTSSKHHEYADKARQVSERKDHEGALREAERALVCDPERLEFWMQTAEYARAAGQIDMARKYYMILSRYSSDRSVDVAVVTSARKALEGLPKPKA